MSYNILLTTLKVNAKVKLVVPTVTIKSTLTCTNCGKISHLVETYHNRKREVLVVPTTTVKSIEPILGTKPNLLN
jgi:iron-sulfur cluster repair protein YtfE (RIC family)